ncbi:hypothetical protein BGZ95_004459 [Linnemannia exigua]|uniref:Uncharacterized protein n=1 Tax=Linnemannia exigua TaxID=604196 RepID=A0AAD4H803_9FUNG|nr:hypothetical protein BGZ95_004459 [Linnemannia exigua]
MSSTSSNNNSARTMRRDEDTKKFWAKVKRIHTDQDINSSDKIQSVLDYINNKFHKEDLRMSAKAKQEVLTQMTALIEEGLRIIDEAEANQHTPRGHGVTDYLDRVQTVLESRY